MNFDLVFQNKVLFPPPPQFGEAVMLIWNPLNLVLVLTPKKLWPWATSFPRAEVSHGYGGEKSDRLIGWQDLPNEVESMTAPGSEAASLGAMAWLLLLV